MLFQLVIKFSLVWLWPWYFWGFDETLKTNNNNNKKRPITFFFPHTISIFIGSYCQHFSVMWDCTSALCHILYKTTWIFAHLSDANPPVFHGDSSKPSCQAWIKVGGLYQEEHPVRVTHWWPLKVAFFFFEHVAHKICPIFNQWYRLPGNLLLGSCNF